MRSLACDWDMGEREANAARMGLVQVKLGTVFQLQPFGKTSFRQGLSALAYRHSETEDAFCRGVRAF